VRRPWDRRQVAVLLRGALIKEANGPKRTDVEAGHTLRIFFARFWNIWIPAFAGMTVMKVYPI
jgi:hypothetical protein